ncbi:ABC transporter ATP-binding protein [Leptothoe sp. LEGE 181152]|nr:ABC transporter ATP-binding protein [Leptothoe sp. LEGE 181152]
MVKQASYRHFWVMYLRPQRRRVVWMAMALLASIGLQVLNPQILRYFIDTALAGGAQQRLIMVALGFMGISLARQGLAIAATYIGETLAWSATNQLRLDLAQHCLSLDLAFHKTHTPGELVERVDGDVDALSRFFSQFVLQVVGNGLLVLGILSVLWFEDWRAGLGLSLFALASFGLLTRLQAIAVAPWRVYREISAEFYGFVVEHLSGLEDIRANGAVSYVMNRCYRILRRWLAAFHRARFTSTLLWGGTVGLFTLGNAISLSLGAYLWYQNAITIGTVYLLFYYTTQLQEPIERIREELEQFQQAAASFQRIQDLLSYRSRQHPGGQAALPQGALSIEFENVRFGYEENEATLQNLTFHLPAGQILGVLGRTGSGKSTLARLLLRFYDIQQGEILLGGVNISQVPLQELPHHVGLVTQDVQIFQTTVRNNLTFFNPHILDQQILATLDELGLVPWLEGLPQGLDTNLGADSGGLSAGQAQLLAFARVFLKDPGLVILDEASSRLDPLTEQLIEQAVDRLLLNRTGIIIAHRLQTVERADQILILDNGEQVEYGDLNSLSRDPYSRFSSLLQINSVT